MITLKRVEVLLQLIKAGTRNGLGPTVYDLGAVINDFIANEDCAPIFDEYVRCTGQIVGLNAQFVADVQELVSAGMVALIDNRLQIELIGQLQSVGVQLPSTLKPLEQSMAYAMRR